MTGFYCFLFSCSLAVLCFAAFLNMEKTEFFQHYANLGEDKVSEEESTTVTPALVKKLYSGFWIFHLSLATIGIVGFLIFPALLVLVEPANDTGSKWGDLYFDQVGKKCLFYTNIYKKCVFYV